MAALTIYQAEAEARWRWGKLFARGFARYSGTRSLPFEVGTKWFGTVDIKGRGKSWEGAFGNADGLSKTKRKPRK
jgi:hypothetical protein